MISVLVKENEEITVKIVIGANKDGNIYCEPYREKEELVKFLGDDVEGEIEEHRIIFRRPSFQDMKEISADVFSFGGEGDIAFNPLAARFAKMKKLLKSWSFKDGQGNPIAATADNITSLNPAIGNVLGAELDSATGGLIR